MSNNRRNRSDSVTAEQAMASTPVPNPPDSVEMDDDARVVFDDIVRARDFTAWTQVDLYHAANLAICLSEIESERRVLRQEGHVIENGKGNPVQNPRHQVIEVLSRRSVALSRMLHVHPEATQGESRHQKERNSKGRETAQKVSDQVDDSDGLIAPPVH